MRAENEIKKYKSLSYKLTQTFICLPQPHLTISSSGPGQVMSHDLTWT